MYVIYGYDENGNYTIKNRSKGVLKFNTDINKCAMFKEFENNQYEHIVGDD